MPHFIIGFVIAALVFGRGVAVDLGPTPVQRIQETFQETVQRVQEFELPEPPAKPATRDARGDTTDAIWKLIGDRSTGTAFVVGQGVRGRTLLVTSAHVVQRRGEYELSGGEFGEEVRYPVLRVIARDEENDLALIEAAPLSPYRPIRVSQWKFGVEQQAVTIAGYGYGEWSEHRTKLIETRRLSDELAREGNKPETWITEEVTKPGHSGSPAYDREENLTGVVIAGGGGETILIHPRYVRWLLEESGNHHLIDRRLPASETPDQG